MRLTVGKPHALVLRSQQGIGCGPHLDAVAAPQATEESACCLQERIVTVCKSHKH